MQAGGARVQGSVDKTHFRTLESTLLLRQQQAGLHVQVPNCVHAAREGYLCTVNFQQSFLRTTDKRPQSLHPGTWMPVPGEQDGRQQSCLFMSLTSVLPSVYDQDTERMCSL